MIETPDFLTETPFRAAGAPGPDGTDVLSDVLRVFRVTGAALLQGVFTAPWCWETPHSNSVATTFHSGATRVIMFHVVAEGRCWVEVDGLPRIWLSAGEIVGFPHGHMHRMGSGDGTPAVPVDTLLPPLPWTELPMLRHGGNGESTHILCVYLHCDDLLFNPLLASLPAMLVMRPGRDTAMEWVNTSIRYLIAEASRGGTGSAALMARLTELLFIESLRMHMIGAGAPAMGWLAALNDRHVSRALNAFHRHPDHDWTVAVLARHVGLSRTALVERFQRLLATSPMRYLAMWRLQLAAQALQSSHDSIAAIAARVGYGSEEAFSRAFKRHAGCSPVAWRRRRSNKLLARV